MIIVVFHVFYLLGKYVYSRYNNSRTVDETERKNFLEKNFDDDDPYIDVGASNMKNGKRGFSGGEEESKAKIKFSPPAYVQRYQAVVDVLTDTKYKEKMKKIVDFGCSELGFCLYLKNLTMVEEAIFVDVDRATLDIYKEKTKPLLVDYLHRRSRPLVLRVFEGSVTEPDKSLEDCDAVVCIELIEHLYPETLTDLPYNIFGFIKPNVAIITTPNADFNVLFDNFNGFRHWDHKFEWTREQFEDWAHNIILRYPEYDVAFQGICNGPEGTENLGACSQMAVFRKKKGLQIEKVPGIEGLYKKVIEYEYPYEIDNRTDEQKILDDAIYFINKFSVNEDELIEEVPLQRLLNVMTNFHITLDDLKEILQNGNYKVVDRERGPVVLVPKESSSSSAHSFNEDAFLDNDIDWDEEPGPPVDYYYRDVNNIDPIEEDDWENEYRFPVITTGIDSIDDENWDSDKSLPGSERHIDSIDDSEINNDKIRDEEAAESSTSSVNPDDISADDIVTESRSNELANSAVDSSIIISSFSETKGSENSEIGKNIQEPLICVDSKIAQMNNSTLPLQMEAQKEHVQEEFIQDKSIKTSSICSMFIEPSKMSEMMELEKSDPFLECSVTSPSVSKTNKKLKLNNCTLSSFINDNSFEEPIYTSSPHVSSSNVNRKRKVSNRTPEHSASSSLNNSNDDLLRTSDTADILDNESSRKFDDPTMCSSESVIASSTVSNEFLPEVNNAESPEQVRHYTGTIPKNLSSKFADAKSTNIQKETKIERISPDTPESLINSWSPEIMDSGYPNSNSPPDLSPEYDLSSIAQDRTSDSESSSMADVPRIDVFNLAEVENRDLANNNLDDEGNNMEAVDDNRHINDIRPLINVLENDLENENDIYMARNGFPVWLLRILQRFDAEGVGINLPMPQPPNENFGG